MLYQTVSSSTPATSIQCNVGHEVKVKDFMFPIHKAMSRLEENKNVYCIRNIDKPVVLGRVVDIVKCTEEDGVYVVRVMIPADSKDFKPDGDFAIINDSNNQVYLVQRG